MDIDLHNKLSAVLSKRIGEPAMVVSVVPVTGGATKHTYVFEALLSGVSRKLVLQLSTAAPLGDPSASFTPRLTAAEDACLMAAASAQGVPVPRVRAQLSHEDGLGIGYITDFVEAEAMGKRIVGDASFAAARGGFAADCGRALAAVHRIPLSEHSYLRHYPAEAQIEAYGGIVAHYGLRSPELAYCLEWAHQRAPRKQPMGVVHGDFRMGNLMTDRDGIRCVLDWESAHAGDPMQDLGWLCMRTWRFGGALPVAGVGTREQLFAAYEAAGGTPVDPDVVRFWEAWGNVKWGIAAVRKGLRYRDGQPATLEQCAIGRRLEEPLWDFFRLIQGAA
jgi:aminoglycoside phosphotransferase (APT) family kinase protein